MTPGSTSRDTAGLARTVATAETHWTECGAQTDGHLISAIPNTATRILNALAGGDLAELATLG
jgi:hypothetical protein